MAIERTKAEEKEAQKHTEKIKKILKQYESAKSNKNKKKSRPS